MHNESLDCPSPQYTDELKFQLSSLEGFNTLAAVNTQKLGINLASLTCNKSYVMFKTPIDDLEITNTNKHSSILDL